MKNNKINPYRLNYIYHPLTRKLNVTYHFGERLKERFGYKLQDLYQIIKKFKYHNGKRFCNNCLTINSKIRNGIYPNSDYLYSPFFDMILIFDRDTRTLLTVERYDTNYFYK